MKTRGLDDEDVARITGASRPTVQGRLEGRIAPPPHTHRFLVQGILKSLDESLDDSLDDSLDTDPGQD